MGRLEACLTPDSACRLLAPCYGSNVPKSISTTECCHLTHVTLTVDFSWIPISCPQVVHAISLMDLPYPPLPKPPLPKLPQKPRPPLLPQPLNLNQLLPLPQLKTLP